MKAAENVERLKTGMVVALTTEIILHWARGTYLITGTWQKCMYLSYDDDKIKIRLVPHSHTQGELGYLRLQARQT